MEAIMQAASQPINYYQQQIKQIKELFFCKDYLYARIIDAKLFIDKNYYSDIDLDAIANKAFFSKFHFIRLFKNTYGQTPHQYLVGVRITHAKRLLKTGKQVTEICFTVGFDSASSFTALFKKMTGYTPSAYQKQTTQSIPVTTVPLIWLPYYLGTQDTTAEKPQF